MDFLDPRNQRRHIIQLYTGYSLVAIAIFLAVTMLLLLAYGFQVSKDGQVIQNGLVFASSRPVNAEVYLDGIDTKKQTNMRLNIPEGSYQLELKRDGYRSWQHQVAVLGGKLVRYDYPLLIPQTLTTTTLKTLAATAPGIVTVTPDNRALLVQQDSSSPSFWQFDLQDTTKEPTNVTVPAQSYTAGGKQSWQIVSWASNKTHALLKHGYGNKGAYEYILFSRTKPTETVNLNTKLQVAPTELTFLDGKFDKYYVYIASDQTLRTAELEKPATTVLIENVLEYDTYQDDTVLYVAESPSKTATTVDLHLKRGGDDYTIRHLAKSSSYYVAVNNYSDNTYVAVADTVKSQPVVLVYKDPLAQLKTAKSAVPVVSLKLAPTFLSFSAGGRFIVAERGTAFATYDAEYKQAVSYQTAQPLDRGQTHAAWADGAHLQYVSNKQLYIFDYDGTNVQALMPATAGSQVFYDAQYRYAFSISPPTKALKSYTLTSTALRTAADL
jgi:hypothetical protein